MYFVLGCYLWIVLLGVLWQSNWKVYSSHCKVSQQLKLWPCPPQICKFVFLLCRWGPGQRAYHPRNHSSLCGAARQIFWQRMYPPCVLTLHWLKTTHLNCLFLGVAHSLSCLLVLGLRIGHHLQLWKGLLHPGRVYTGWRSTGNLEEKCAQGHRAGRHASRGNWVSKCQGFSKKGACSKLPTVHP